MLDTIPELLADLTDLYEDLHAHPELSFCEVRTAGVLADRLEALGYEVTRGVGGTGVVAMLANGDGPTVMLRADVDALPVEEATGLPYASTVRATGLNGEEVPVAHACGHDMHAAWMIGVATVLMRHRDAWSGRVMIVIQPAEKMMAAIERIVRGEAEAAGAPKDPEVEVLYGFPPLHNDADTIGTVAAAFLDHFGPDRVMEGPLVPASEDFGHFATRGGFPSAFWFVGGADAELWTKAFAAGTLASDIPSNHSPFYAPVPTPTLSTGIEAMVTAAMCWLRPS